MFLRTKLMKKIENIMIKIEKNNINIKPKNI